MKIQIVPCLMVLSFFLTATEEFSPPVCSCFMTRKRPIGRYIESIVVIPPNSDCQKTEIIATLKRTGRKVCLEPEAPWVKRIIKKNRTKDIEAV